MKQTTKERLKGMAAGIVMGSLLVGGGFAKQATETISVMYENIRILIDGAEYSPKDANGNMVEPFTYNGTTYLPVRAIATAFDKDVAWDGQTNTVTINSKGTNSKVDTPYYSITIPDTWKDKYTYEITEGASYNYFLSLYHTATHTATGGGSGTLFSIALIPAGEDDTNYPESRNLGILDVYRIGSYQVLALMPSDVQWIEEYYEEYSAMSKEIPNILQTISFQDECTFYPAE